MKTCSRCAAEYPATVEYFVPHKLCRDGLSGVCRPCWRTYHRSWKAANKPRTAPRRRQLYAERHRESQQRKRQEYEARAPVRARAQMMRQGMKDRSRLLGLPFDAEDLTVASLVARMEDRPDCPCCRQPLDVSFKHDGRKNDRSPTIDRLRPLDGYVVSNIEILCWRCNNLKRDATAAELRRIADWMEGRGLA